MISDGTYITFLAIATTSGTGIYSDEDSLIKSQVR